MSLPAHPQPPVALYLHVPFCLSICPYCDFVVYAGRASRGPASRVEAFVLALENEIRLRGQLARAVFGRPLPLASVYLGGGTPSLLSASQVAQLLEQVADGFGIAAGAEVTLELNPGSADRGDLAGFRAAGVNRLSVGAQSFETGELRRLGRRHGPEDVAETVRLARTAGFANLSLDLLYDIPGQTRSSWRRTLSRALALEPDHLSAYALALDDPDAEGLAEPTGDHLPLRAGARRWRELARAGQDADQAAELYELADNQLWRAGLCWYELSNWARSGHESRHNLAYWRRAAYEAAGPGAHAFDGALTRRWNGARLEGYLAALSADRPGDPQPPPGGIERLGRSDAIAEQAILGLRTRAGLPAELARLPALASALRWGRSEGLLEAVHAGGLRLTVRGRLLASELFWRLLPQREWEPDDHVRVA